jgi:NhaP-type Na+/H+ or K+/H+ antiporter
MITYRRTRRNWRLVAFWFFGALCILFGSMISGRLELSQGVTETGYFIALIVSLILVMVGGLLWIAVAIAAKHGAE